MGSYYENILLFTLGVFSKAILCPHLEYANVIWYLYQF